MKTLFNLLLYCLLSLFLHQFASAQGISGKVVDEGTGEPLFLANVILYSLPDSAFISGTVTDDKGMFMLPANSESHGFIKISYIGYTTLYENITKLELGTLHLSMTGQDLSEVIVKAARSYLKPRSDGVAVDIANSHLKNLGVASDILSQLPFVVSGKDGLSVFEKRQPLIYIDNREIRDLSELESLNSNSIKRIEVINNPGARYSASVKSVIRIETIKKQGDGFSGNLYGGTVYNKRLSDMFIGNLNYRTGNLDLFCKLDYRQTRQKYDTDWIQRIENPGLISEIEQETWQKSDRDNLKASLGTSYTLDNRNGIGIRYEYQELFSEKKKIGSMMNVFDNGSLIEKRKSEQLREQINDRHYINAYYYQDITERITMKLDVDWSKGTTENRETVKDKIVKKNQEENLVTDSYQDYDLVAARLSFDTPLKGSGTLSYGSEYSYTKNQQDFVVDETYTEDFKTNHNTSKQNLLALYVQYRQSFGAFGVELGLRYEYADFSYFEKDIRKEEQSRRYSDIFPNIGLSYAKKEWSAAISFSRSISRPIYYQLRNSIQYNTAYSYEAGNPFLQPSIDNSISVNLGWRGFMFAMSYDIYQDARFWVSTPYNKRTVISTFYNLDDYQNISANIFYGTTIGRWKPNISIAVSKDFFKYGEPEQSYNKPTFSFSLRNSFILPHKWQLGIDMTTNTAGHTWMNHQSESFRLDAYVSKLLWKDKLRINFRATDILGTVKYENTISLFPVYMRVHNNMHTQGFSLSITYNFNTTKSKYKGKEAGKELKIL